MLFEAGRAQLKFTLDNEALTAKMWYKVVEYGLDYNGLGIYFLTGPFFMLPSFYPSLQDESSF
jgi:hypothetical protein